MPNGLRRSRLLDKLAALLDEGHLFVDAPAGYGKTMLLQSLQTERPHTYLIPLTPADGDPAVLRERLAGLLRPENTLLLDDVHHLQGAETAVAWLQQQMRRPQPRWVLAGRQPLFPAADLALYGKINQLSMADLAFDEHETALWLGERGTPAAWQQRLEGWPIGLSLLKNLSDVADPEPIAEQQLFAYLTEQLFAALPPDLQRFMTVTAVPLAFTPALAARLLPGSDPHAAIQTVLTRNLFLYREAPGSDGDGPVYRYHDLIRTFLRRQLPPTEVGALLLMTAEWLCERGRIGAAVEHALDGGLAEKAAALLARPEAFAEIRVNGRFLTHHRWINALPPEIVAQRPLLLLRNAAALFHLRARRREAWDYLERGVALAAAGGHAADYRLGLRYAAFFHVDEGRNRQALALYQQLLALPDLEPAQRIAALQDMIGPYTFAAQFDQAAHCYRQVRALQPAASTLIADANFASVWAARGRWAAAQAALTAALEQVAAQNNFQDMVVIHRGLGHLLMDRGDWAGQRENLAALDAVLARVELVDERIGWIVQHDRALLAVADGRFAAAEALLKESDTPDVRAAPLLRLLFAAVQTWLYRRQGLYREAIRSADAALAVESEFPYYAGRLALERDIAALLAGLAADDLDGFHFSPQTRALIPMRARAELVRLRMALALVCWRQGNPRWRRLAQRALAEGQRPFYQNLLTQRDPELAAAFWQMLLLEALEPEQTDAALREIGQSQPLLPLLRHPSAETRRRAADLLAQIGAEDAMPALAAAVAAESDKATKAALQTALETLELLPPPPLYVRLMGDFGLQRGGGRIDRTEDFHRPIVARLLQYFVMHAGQPVPRDRILEELWPGGDPEQTAVTLRTVNSHLRSALDPHMRRRGPNRYIVVERDNYRFDPHGVVASDVQQFTRQVEAALRSGDPDDAALEALAQALDGYAPLLPDLPYADWLLEPRQRLEDLYLEGCLCAAEAYLARRRWGESQTWLQRALQTAPWLEKGWQLLMRLHARQGRRGLALKAYREAAVALERELGVAPSQLTVWLHDKAQRGEPI